MRKYYTFAISLEQEMQESIQSLQTLWCVECFLHSVAQELQISSQSLAIFLVKPESREAICIKESHAAITSLVELAQAARVLSPFPISAIQ